MDSSHRIRKHDDSSRSDRHGSSRDHYRDERRDRDGHRGGDRRRSRSPHGHRSSRHEQDSYSSSRNHRASEREEKYYGRDSRGDGGNSGGGQWNRDRGDRGPRRRDDDDRRGGGRGREQADRREPRERGGEKADRDEFAMQARKRSRTPPPKKREPTPDLTDIVPVNSRKRRLTQWDIKPPGYESVTAEQAKLSGMFPLPGAPRAQPIDPSKLQSLATLSGATAASTAALKPTNARQSKRLFVHNIPPNTTEEEIIEFFNLQLNGLNVVESNDPCLTCQFSNTRDYAMLEFKNPSEATMALALDGIVMQGSGGMNGNDGGSGLVIRRPKDYIVAAIASDETSANGEVSTAVADSQNKISIGNILLSLDDDQVKELLTAFGQLKSFVLVKDKSTEESRGIAFCEYADQEHTDLAVQGLNGMDLGDQPLKVQRASIGVSQSAGLEMSVNAMSILAGTTSTDLADSRVLQLLNMVTAEDLINDEDYQDIVDDIKEECSKYGKVLDVKIPRPSMGSRQSSGVGKIFVKFEDKAAANGALVALAGRKFDNRTVVTTYFSEELFEVNAW